MDRPATHVVLLCVLTAAFYGSAYPAAALSNTWVYKSAGAVQCENIGGVPLDVMAKTLTTEGIEVLSSCRSHDGRAYLTVCGGGTGAINVYEVHARDLQQAKGIGFDELTKVEGYAKQSGNCRLSRIESE